MDKKKFVYSLILQNRESRVYLKAKVHRIVDDDRTYIEIKMASIGNGFHMMLVKAQ